MSNNTHLDKIPSLETLPILEGLLTSGWCFQRGQNVLLPFLFAESVTPVGVKPFVIQTFFVSHFTSFSYFSEILWVLTLEKSAGRWSLEVSD